MKKFLTRSLAADYLSGRGLPTTKGTLAKQASCGGGPDYELYGNKSVYTPENLDRYVDAKLRAPRTSDTGKAA